MLKINCFGLFFVIATANIETLFAVFYPPPNGGGKIDFGDGWPIPSQLGLKLSWDSEWPASSDFTIGKSKCPLANIWQIAWVGNHLDAFCRQEILTEAMVV